MITDVHRKATRGVEVEEHGRMEYKQYKQSV